MAKSLHVWITRAQPGADETAAHLLDLGHHPLVAPVLELRALAGVEIDLDGVGALAFTSANAVRAFSGANAERGLPVFAVGDATAQAARAAGFCAVFSASGDVAGLAEHIVKAPDSFAGALLHPGAADLAGDLVGDLTRAGLRARALPLYETLEVVTLPEAVSSALAAGVLDVALLHSPKAARVLARLLDAPAFHGQVKRLTAVGLSPACLAPLARLPFAQIRSAGNPIQADLLALVCAL
jgi:uroporphyrinogen-III synthase